MLGYILSFAYSPGVSYSGLLLVNLFRTHRISHITVQQCTVLYPVDVSYGYMRSNDRYAGSFFYGTVLGIMIKQEMIRHYASYGLLHCCEELDCVLCHASKTLKLFKSYPFPTKTKLQ